MLFPLLRLALTVVSNIIQIVGIRFVVTCPLEVGVVVYVLNHAIVPNIVLSVRVRIPFHRIPISRFVDGGVDLRNF